MLEKRLSLSSSYLRLIKAINENQSDVSVSGVVGCSRALLSSLLFKDLSKDAVYILPDQNDAIQFYTDLAELVGEQKVVYFPASGRKAWNELGPSGVDVGKKTATLKKLLQEDHQIVVTCAAALCEKMASPEDVRTIKIELSVGQEYDFYDLIEKLVDYGYTREASVDRPGEFSVRGGIIDVYLFEGVNPYRIEFFGDEIESIREFDVENQKSIKNINILELLPISAVGLYGPFDEHPQNMLSLQSSLLDFVKSDSLLCFFDYSLVLNSMKIFVRIYLLE